MKLTKVFIKAIYKPVDTFKALSYSNESIKYGWITTIGFAVLYTFTSIILSLKGFTPIAEPSLPIPDADYYLYQSFFTIPVGIIGVSLNYFIALGFLKLFSIDVKNQYLWGIISIASVLPSFFTMWILETFVVALFYSANEWTYLTFDLIRIAIGTFWTLILTILAIKSIDKVKWWQSIVIGTISSGAMGTLMGICYR